ncbi:aldo-keto reductase [Moniliophthora roreri MCA 2997]|uniref:Aldo-keto reductase n=2 Tax=Moniliophthora roreri TaxID=221103 RepID=V2WSA1_MONRO|nr:aldo-keto reductase [Moniliophthora roreri MCA 2997]KAI3620868.1 aldo-keto reductase [Moniliophthora roreri]
MAKPVEYRRLGKSGLKVSVPILGAMSYGSPNWFPHNWIMNEEQSLPIIKAAWDRGINTIDTANVYSNGESEKIVGKFMQKYEIPRNQIIIATKCYHLVSHDQSLNPYYHPELYKDRQHINNYGLSRNAIFNAVNASLERLNTTYIDLLQIHRFDPDTAVEETMKALHDLVESGKVRYIGASSMRCWQFALMNEVAEKRGWTKFISMQNEYSLLYREEEREMIPYCNFHGIGIVPWAALATGVLARPASVTTRRGEAAKGSVYERALTPADEEIINRVEEIAKKKDISMAKVSLAWVAAKVVSPIVGISSEQRIEDNVVNGTELTEEEIKYLEEPYVPKVVQGHK